MGSAHGFVQVLDSGGPGDKPWSGQVVDAEGPGAVRGGLRRIGADDLQVSAVAQIGEEVPGAEPDVSTAGRQRYAEAAVQLVDGVGQVHRRVHQVIDHVGLLGAWWGTQM